MIVAVADDPAGAVVTVPTVRREASAADDADSAADDAASSAAVFAEDAAAASIPVCSRSAAVAMRSSAVAALSIAVCALSSAVCSAWPADSDAAAIERFVADSTRSAGSVQITDFLPATV